MRFGAPILAAVLCCLAAGPLLAEDSSHSDSRQLRINGVDVTVKRNVKSVMERGTSLLTVRVVLDFSGLRNRLGQVLNTFSTDNSCGRTGIRNVVMPLSKTDLHTVNGSVVLGVAGMVETWACIENPIPNSKVEWQVQSVGPVQTRVPVVRTWAGDPLKKLMDAQGFSASYAISTRVEDRKVKVRVDQSDGQRSVTSIGGLTNVGAEIAEQIRTVLQQVIDAELDSVLPSEFRQLELNIADAKLALNGDRFEVAISIRSDVPADKVSAIRSYLR